MILECSGSAGGATLALDAIRRGGRYVAIGIFGAPATLPVDHILYKELTVTSGFAATPRSWLRALRLLEDGAVDLETLISSVEPLGAWETVLERLANSDGMKIVFDPRLPGLLRMSSVRNRHRTAESSWHPIGCSLPIEESSLLG